MIDWTVPADEASTRQLLSDVLLGLSVVLLPIMWFVERRAVVWLWVGYGVGITVAGYAASRTDIGQKSETWFRRIGPGGRFVCIVFAAICIWGGIWTIEPPVLSLMSFVFGSAILLLGVSVVRLCNRAWYGRRR